MYIWCFKVSIMFWHKIPGFVQTWMEKCPLTLSKISVIQLENVLTSFPVLSVEAVSNSGVSLGSRLDRSHAITIHPFLLLMRRNQDNTYYTYINMTIQCQNFLLRQLGWAVTLKVSLPSPPPFPNIICMQYNTHIAPLPKAVAWSWREGNKHDSYRSNQALTASIGEGENAVFTNIVFTETAAW